METNNSLKDIYREHHSKNRGDLFVLQGEIREKFLNSLIGKGKKILDLGCRDGALTELYCKDNDVTGIDIDILALEKAKNRLGINIKSFDLNGIWYVDKNSYDFVVIAEVLEHLYYPEKVVSKIYDVLRSDGKIVGSVLNAFSLKNRIRLFLGRKKNTPLADPTHINHFSREELKNILSKQFKDVKIYPLGRFSFLDRIFPGMFSFMMLFEARK